MTIDEAIVEWQSKKRRMGCVAATDFLCHRVPGFQPKRLTLYTPEGDLFQHVVASDGTIQIDLAPYAAVPRE